MQLKEAISLDISYIVSVEHKPEFREFIGNESIAEHEKALRDPGTRYVIAFDDENAKVGYAILRGVQSEHRNIELKRIVINAPGKGYGKQVLSSLLKKVFLELKAHRLWLDVYETNLRAQHVYRTLGFRQDGVFREAVYRDGRFHSLLLMSLLEDEYRSSINAHE